jgi:hypothetical protein
MIEATQQPEPEQQPQQQPEQEEQPDIILTDEKLHEST